MNFGNTIFELRKKKNVTQDEMAAELGVTAAAISKWENNYTLPDILMLCALADYFKVTTDELLGRNVKPKHAVIAAATLELGKKIEALAKRYGFTAVQVCHNYQDALTAALADSTVEYIFVSCEEPLTKEERDTMPDQLHVYESLSQTNQDILGGFEMMLQHLV